MPVNRGGDTAGKVRVKRKKPQGALQGAVEAVGKTIDHAVGVERPKPTKANPRPVAKVVIRPLPKAKGTSVTQQDSSAGDAARRIAASVTLAVKPKAMMSAAAARGELVHQGDHGPSVAGPTTRKEGGKTLAFKDAAHQRAHEERRQEAKIGRANKEAAMAAPSGDKGFVGPQLSEAKPAIRARLAASQQSKETAAQRRKDDASIREVGTFERGNPSTPLEKQAAQRAEAAKKQIRLRATPRTKKSLDLLDRYGKAAEADKLVRAMGRQKTNSISKDKADRIDRATADAQAKAALEKKRGALTVGNALGNFARSVKDSFQNPVPVVQVLAKAGKEEAHRLAAGAVGKHADAPTADALVKSFTEHDPIVQTLKHGPEAGARAFVHDPLAGITELAPFARGARLVVDAAKAGGSIKAAKEAERIRRVRPTQRVTNTKTAPLKGKAGRARLKTDVAEARTGNKVDARVQGPVRTYDRRVTVRAAQKAKDTIQASRGKDPVRLTGKKGAKLERRHEISQIARHKIVSQNQAGAARDGSALSDKTKKGPPDVLQRHRGFVERVEAKATPKQRIVAGELATHIDGASGHTVGSRMRELKHQIGDGQGGPLWKQQHDLKAKQLREGGETNRRRIDAVAAKHADEQVAAAQRTGEALADYQRYVNKLAPVRAAYDKAHRDAQAAHRAYADATPGQRDAEMQAMFDANRALEQAGAALQKVNGRHGAMVEAEQLAHARAQFGHTVTQHHIDTGDLDPTAASMRLKLQMAVAHGKLRHDASSSSGWRDPKTGKEVSLEQIDKMPEAPSYMHYGINASQPEVVIGKQMPGTGFTGAGVHGYDFASRPLSEVHGGQLDKMGQNDLAKHLLEGAVTGPEGRLRLDSAHAVAKARSEATGVDWVPVKAGRVTPNYSREWHDPELSHRPGPKEDGYVVMPKAKADLWHEQMKPMGRLSVGGQLVTRRFLRGVLGLNPGWIAGNNMDGALRSLAAGASPLKSGKEIKLVDELRKEAGLEDAGHLPTGAAAHDGALTPDVTPLHPEARRVFDSLLGHVGTNRYAVPKDIRDFMNSGELTNGLRKAGVRTDIGEMLHKVARPWTESAVRRHGNALIDKSLDFSSRLEERWIRAAQGKAAQQLAKELGVAVHEHRALAHRILDDPAAADRFHELTLNIVGDYIRRAPKTRHWQTAAVPFMPWIKAAVKWTMHTLPADHPLKLAMYLQAAKATEEQRRLLGMSDYITKAEARSMHLPDPVDGFLTGAATVAPGWVVPFAGMFSPGAVGQMVDDPVKYAGRSIVPQVGTIAAKALGQTGSLPERAIDEATDIAGLTKNAGVGRLHLGLPGAQEAAIRTILTYVPGAARAIGPLGLGKQIQGGLGPTQTGSYDAQGKLDTGRPKSAIGDAIGMGAQSIPNEAPNVSVAGLKPYETNPDQIVYNEVTGGFQPGLVTKADQAKASAQDPEARAKANLTQLNAPKLDIKAGRLATGDYSTAYSGNPQGLDYFRDSAQGPLIQKAPGSPKEIRIMAQGMAKEGVPKLKDLAHPQIAKDPNYLKALRLAKTLPGPKARATAPVPSAAGSEPLTASAPKAAKALKPIDVKGPRVKVLHELADRVAEMPPGAKRDKAATDLMRMIKRHTRYLKANPPATKVMHGTASSAGAPDPTSFTTSGGKIVPVPGFPGEEAAQGIIPAIEAVSKKYGLTMTDAFDRSGTKHKSPGHEVTGTAADFAGSDAAMTKAAHDLAAQGYLVGYDGTGGTKDWPGHGPSTKAGANAHLHVEFVGSGAPASGTASGTAASGPSVKGPTDPNQGPDAWARHILKKGGFPLTSENVRAMSAWARAEGGHYQNDSKFNPLNTTQPEPGAGNTGTQGNIKVYNSWRQGDAATLKTLNNGMYKGVVAALKKGASAEAVADAVAASPWGTKGELIRQILGGPMTTAPGVASPGVLDASSGSSTDSSTTGGGAPDVNTLLDPSLSPDERYQRLNELIAALSGGRVDAQGVVHLPRKLSGSTKRSAPGSKMDPVSAESKRLRARIRAGK